MRHRPFHGLDPNPLRPISDSSRSIKIVWCSPQKVVSAVLAIGCDRSGRIIRSGVCCRCITFLRTEGIERDPAVGALRSVGGTRARCGYGPARRCRSRKTRSPPLRIWGSLATQTRDCSKPQPQLRAKNAKSKNVSRFGPVDRQTP